MKFFLSIGICSFSFPSLPPSLKSADMSLSKRIHSIKNLSEAHGISGHEDEVRNLFVQSTGVQGHFSADSNGSVVCTHGTSGPKIMVVAHMDEVGFLVQLIHSSGFLSIVPVGGWWSHTLLSQRVQILTRSGKKIIGLIGSKPPHFLPEQERKNVIPVDSIFIDVGATSREQVEDDFGIHVGDPVAPWSPFTVMEHKGRVMGKAFDDRAGMAAMIEATRILHKEGHPNILQSTGTVQEEVGIRGARTIAAVTRPDCAIILEAPPADDTLGFPVSDSQGSLGKGVQIRLYDPTAITNPKLARLAEETAISEQIPYQLTVRKSGGTDAGALHISGKGIPCIVLGIPVRYIHAHNGIMDMEDFDAAVRLVTALVKKLDSNTVNNLTSYL